MVVLERSRTDKDFEVDFLPREVEREGLSVRGVEQLLIEDEDKEEIFACSSNPVSKRSES